jgi:ribosome-associated protein
MTKTAASLELVRICCRALSEKKAIDLRVLDVAALSSITDYLVIATGTSEPHLRALRVELTKAFAQANTRPIGAESAAESGWVVVDAFDVMIHIFTGEKRELFGLEDLWKDAREIPLSRILRAPRKAPAPGARARPAARKPRRSPQKP